MAENANATMHNLLPARGSLVRDSKAWADYLTESVRLYGGASDVMFAAHGIPRFGNAEVVAYLKSHRDAYKFLHDQTVRLMNKGLTPAEIADAIELPESLASQWYNRGYYGTMSHNSKAVYQRYLGWYDGNPANLWPLPPEESAGRYLEAMGGADAVLARATEAVAEGELRWAATLLNHVVFADGDNRPARDALAEAYTQLGFAAEAGTWRNIYLNAALELRADAPFGRIAQLRPEVLSAATTSMILDVAAVRFDVEAAAGREFAINIELTDRRRTPPRQRGEWGPRPRRRRHGSSGRCHRPPRAPGPPGDTLRLRSGRRANRHRRHPGRRRSLRLPRPGRADRTTRLELQRRLTLAPRASGLAPTRPTCAPVRPA